MTQLATDAGKGASAGAIQAHYDISNEFFSLWLDSTLSYSSALWEEGDTLESAQVRKLEFHLDAAHVQSGHRVLDIGCGWGALLRRAVAHRNVERAVGLTLSREQFEWARAENADEARIALHFESWSQHEPARPYDAIISVGAFEHFAKTGLSLEGKADAYREFFQWCHRHSCEGSWLSLQSIVYENFDERHPNSFVEEIFPESDLPRLSEVCAASDGLFEVVRLQNDRSHYARTLRAWYIRLRKNRSRAIELVGEATYAKYERYLAVFVVGFHVGSVNLARLALRRIDKPVRLYA